MKQMLLTKAHRAKMLDNWHKCQNGESASDMQPVVKFFHPYGAGTWLFTELDEDGDRLFGLCDLGMGFPELGYASLQEMTELRAKINGRTWPFQAIERDSRFRADKTLGEYAEDARQRQCIAA